MKRVLVVLVIAACGGGQSSTKGNGTPPGDTHASPPDAGTQAVAPEVKAPPEPVPPQEPPPPPGPPVTFDLKNSGERDVIFTTTKGWQAVVFAYSGKPPKAKSMLLYENACSASCDAPDADRCPVCPEPKNKKEEEKMAKHETSPAGGAFQVAWDGKILQYEKTKAGKKSCQCWRKADPPAGTYTVKACGLRAAKTTGTGSKPVCAEAEMTLPLAQPSQTITLDFAK